MRAGSKPEGRAGTGQGSRGRRAGTGGSEQGEQAGTGGSEQGERAGTGGCGVEGLGGRVAEDTHKPIANNASEGIAKSPIAGREQLHAI